MSMNKKEWKREYRKRKIACKECPSCGCRPARVGVTLCELCHTTRQKYYKLKRDETYNIIFKRYGEFCTCCGETDREFLTIDHIDGNGNKHRKEVKRAGGVGFYQKLVQLGLPEGFRTRCFNCNIAAYHNGGVCPHQVEVNRIIYEHV